MDLAYRIARRFIARDQYFVEGDLALPRRVVARFLLASQYFNVGDIVLYGKWKNKRGILKSFGQDPHGNPTATIEPVPKGRKQDVVMGLFKFWRADVNGK